MLRDVSYLEICKTHTEINRGQKHSQHLDVGTEKGNSCSGHITEQSLETNPQKHICLVLADLALNLLHFNELAPFSGFHIGGQVVRALQVSGATKLTNGAYQEELFKILPRLFFLGKGQFCALELASKSLFV